MSFMFERSFLVKWLAAVVVCVAFLGACGSTAVEPKDSEPAGLAVTTTTAGGLEAEPDLTDTTQTNSPVAETTASTTIPQAVTSTTATPASTPTTVKATTTTSAPVTSTTAPTPTFEVETVEPEAPGQELISTVSPSA